MNHFWILCLFFFLVSGLPVPNDEGDEDCEVTWVTVRADGNPAAVLNSNHSNTLPSTSNTTSTLPVTGDHISAPVDTRAVPSDAAIYTPSDSTRFDCDDFNKWMSTQKKNPSSSKFLKVSPGTYEYMLGPVHPAGADPNLYASSNIAIGFMPGAWTLDLRDVTFTINVTPENKLQRPDQAIYINQSEDFTILGGTIWWDQGEQWSQATVKSIASNGEGGDPIVTLLIDQGYNTTAWAAMGPRNIGCIDISKSAHYTRPGCNFWYTSGYTFDFDNRKVSFRAGERSNLKEGYVLYIQSGPNSLTTIASENNGNFHVKGMTSNGATAQYGLNNKRTATYEDVYYVNPPARPGYAPRVNGPTLSWGHINLPNFDAGGEAPAIYKNSKWQYTGNTNDLLDSNTVELPAAGT